MGCSPPGTIEPTEATSLPVHVASPAEVPTGRDGSNPSRANQSFNRSSIVARHRCARAGVRGVTSAAERLHVRARAVSGQSWAALAAAVLLAWWAWPEVTHPLRYFDSEEYLAWPAGARMLGYPLLLRAIGTGAGLLFFQIACSLACFGYLGWVLARGPGVLAAGVLALAPAIAHWNVAVLSESLTLSMLALLVALGVRLCRGSGSLGLFAVWSLAAGFFGMLRSGNVLVLPFLLLPFWKHGRGWKHGRRRLWVATGLTAAIFVAVAVQTQRSQIWRINYDTAFQTRVFTNSEARAYFEARGMPARPLLDDKQEFRAWFLEHAASSYPIWVVRRWGSYRVAWDWLVKEDESGYLREKYFERQERLTHPAVAPLGDWLFRWSAVPQWIWVCGLLVPAAIDWRRRAKPSVVSLFAISLGIGTYVQAFASYHGSGSGMMRHLLAASALYRFAFFVALFATVQSLRRKAVD